VKVRGVSGASSLLSLLAACAVWAWAASASAEDEPVELLYRAPAGCPDEPAFRAEVSQKTSKLRSPGPGEQARSFKVQIANGGTRGTLMIRDVHGEEAVRSVRGEECRDVVSALALAVAIAVDPSAGVPPPEPPAEPPPPPAPPPIPPRDEPPPRPPPSSMPAVARWNLALAAEGVGGSAAGPGLGLGGGIAVEARRSRGILKTLALRLSVHHLISDTELAAGRASFARTTATLEGCGRAVHVGHLTWSSCLFVMAGVLRAEGADVALATSDVRAWGAFGPGLRFRYAFAGAAFAELGGRILLPFTRDRYYFRPDTTVYEVPTLAAELSLGLGYEF
jgi:hypothetical protein